MQVRRTNSEVRSLVVLGESKGVTSKEESPACLHVVCRLKIKKKDS